MRQNGDTMKDRNLESILERISATFDARFEPFRVDDIELEVLTIANMPGHLDTLLRRNAIHNPLKDLPLWAKVWPASFVLGRFLRKFEPQGKTFLELGAGMGVCSLIAARLGFGSVTASDKSRDAIDFAQANILRNNLGAVASASYLDLTRAENHPQERWDVIAASELLYLEELHRPLLKFVSRHLAPGGRAFFCTDLSRAQPRFKKLAARDFSIREGGIGVTTREDGAEERRIYNIMILERK